MWCQPSCIDQLVWCLVVQASHWFRDRASSLVATTCACIDQLLSHRDHKINKIVECKIDMILLLFGMKLFGKKIQQHGSQLLLDLMLRAFVDVPDYHTDWSNMYNVPVHSFCNLTCCIIPSISNIFTAH